MDRQQQQLNLLVYDPQSNATPNNKSKSTAAAADEQAMTIAGTNDNAADSENTADAASNSNSMPGRQRKRRSLFGTAKLSPTSKAAKQQRKSTVTGRHKDGASSRRACLTEIIFEDVQKAKELFGFRQKSTVTAAGATEMATTAAATATVTEPTLQSHPVVTRLMQQQQQMEAEPDDSSNVRSRTTTSRRVFAPIALTEDDFDEQKSAVPTAAAMVTLPRRRSHRHRRASSDLVSDAPLSASSVAIDAAAASDLLLTAGHQLNQSSINHASSLEESSFHSQQQQQQLLSQAPSSVRSLPLQQQQQQQQHSPAHQRRVARFWELKRLLVELTKRKADKCRQLAALEAKEKSLSGEFCPRSDSQHHTDHSGSSSLPRNQPNLHQPPQHHQQPHHQSTVGSASGQLCFPTQYLVAVEEETVHSELVQLQEEAAVQRAMVEANARLLRECQADKLGRQLKRKRTQEYQRSQEKLRSINQRIAEIRTRDSAAASAAAAAGAADAVHHQVQSEDARQSADSQLQSPVLSVGQTGTWSPPVSGVSTFGQGQQICRHLSLQQPRHLPERRMKSFWQQQHSNCAGSNASAVASTVSVDSGYQEISCCTSSTTSLESHLQRGACPTLRTFQTSATATAAAPAAPAAAATAGEVPASAKLTVNKPEPYNDTAAMDEDDSISSDQF
ncbi:hypothetical protein BOX15_Mlig034136g1 [Macrostomum lignano]|uniref:Uncharacterized protein n=1 Tax=Macrostomum lignano TaxID=282301 RepID=A0A267FXW9_9PLAT|nr:hypothetical protein BOX15_Mlig034136g1 [Macrostomum lignano]